MAETMDRRKRKTREALLKAMIELLKEKNIYEISVRELADRADINRGTFYLHYKDPFDMMSQLEKEVLDTLTNVLKSHTATEIKENPLIIFETLYIYVSENAELIKLLLGNTGSISFLSSLTHVVRTCCIGNWMKLFALQETKKYNYFSAFIVSGCVALVNEWLKTGRKESPKELAILSRDLIRSGVSVLVHE